MGHHSETEKRTKAKKPESLPTWPVDPADIHPAALGVRSQRFCQHRRACLPHALQGLVKTTAGAYVFKAGLNLVLGLAFRKAWRRPATAIPPMFGADAARFALFLGTFTATFRAVQCGLRVLRQREDRWNAFIAGGIAGFTQFIDVPSRRGDFSLYAMTLAGYGAVLAARKRNIVPRVPKGDVLFFLAMCGFLMYFFIYEPGALPGGYYRWLLMMSGGEKSIIDRWTAARKRRNLMQVPERF